MFDPDSPSASSAAPPPPAAQSHSADYLHQHPLWQQAAGKAPKPPPPAKGRGRGKALKEDVLGEGARFERISLLSLELQGAGNGGDGADSALLSSDDENDGDKYADAEEFDYEDDDDEDNMSTVKEEEERKPSKDKSTSELLSAAVFGDTHKSFFRDIDSESSASNTSSKRKRDDTKQCFRVKGVNCVGCALTHRIGPVERFVTANAGRMSEVALWKMAALTWKVEVVEPAHKEGVYVLEWPWRKVADHFRLHTTNPVVGRTHMIQSLTAMRCQIEQRLVRVENGERDLDKQNADLCLKVMIVT